MTCFVAERDGEVIAAGALNVANGIALLAGAATIPSARKQGAQRALLHARLRFAVERGVDLAMVVTQPGSASQRNAERQGFRPVYTRAKWQRTSTVDERHP
jgi:N-acetylglutamate synthase-like GNAT family acetyltransferase